MLYYWSGHDLNGESFRSDFTGIVNSQVVSCDCYIDDSVLSGQSKTDLTRAGLGEVDVFKYCSTGIHSVRRTRAHVRSEGSDDLLLYVPLTSSYVVRQDGREIELRPGTAAFVTLDRPLEAAFIGEDSRLTAGANVRLPRSLVRSRFPRVDECLVDLIPVEVGAGRLMMALLQAVFKEARHLDQTASMLIGDALVDAICAFGQTPLSGKPVALPGPSASRYLTRMRVEQFILAHLADPALSPALIAARCNISLRGLHLAFEDTDWTVTAWIKEQRLLCCQAELRDPALHQKTVAEIAYDWGFKDLSHFSRAYKARFGVPPGHDRGGE